MNERFEITPGRSIGPFVLGMSRSQVWDLHRCPITSFYKTSAADRRTDDFTLLGIHVYYDASDCANCVEAHTSVPHGKVALILDGNRLEAPSVGDLREICSLIPHALPMNDFDSGFEMPGIGLCVYSHDYENDNSRVDAISVMPPV